MREMKMGEVEMQVLLRRTVLIPALAGVFAAFAGVACDLPSLAPDTETQSRPTENHGSTTSKDKADDSESPSIDRDTSEKPSEEEVDSGNSDENSTSPEIDVPLVEFDYSCIAIDRIQAPKVLPPAGLQVRFRVLDCEGNPIGALPSSAVRVINDEKGLPFGDGFEGGSVSELAVPSNYGLFSLLSLDLSDSIVRSGVRDQMIDGALAYVEGIAHTPSSSVQHQVALMVFGRPNGRELLLNFTDDYSLVRQELEALRQVESLGSTDLYGSYTHAIDLLHQLPMEVGDCNLDLAEKFLVLMTDGTHEAGDEDAMRAAALEAKQEHTDFHIYSIGLDGNYDSQKLSELASTSENFVHVGEVDQLKHAFSQVAYRVDAVAKSNYVVGVCTPIALGDEASLTIEVQLESTEGENADAIGDAVSLPYPVESLNGDVGQCVASTLVNAPSSGSDDGKNKQCGCNTSSESSFDLPVVIRDFQQEHPDFEYTVSTDRGIVASKLGSDGKPVYAGNPKTTTTNGAIFFDQWYRDVPGVNSPLLKQLVLERSSDGLLQYNNDNFFPIDGEGWGNEGNSHNYHFTLETHLKFTYHGGEQFSFRGDDDLWLFINGQLAIDLGGVHSAQSQTIDLDEQADVLGIAVGHEYSFDLFFAERHRVASSFAFQTTLDLDCR